MGGVGGLKIVVIERLPTSLGLSVCVCLCVGGCARSSPHTPVRIRRTPHTIQHYYCRLELLTLVGLGSVPHMHVEVSVHRRSYGLLFVRLVTLVTCPESATIHTVQ